MTIFRLSKLAPHRLVTGSNKWSIPIDLDPSFQNVFGHSQSPKTTDTIGKWHARLILPAIPNALVGIHNVAEARSLKTTTTHLRRFTFFNTDVLSGSLLSPHNLNFLSTSLNMRLGHVQQWTTCQNVCRRCVRIKAAWDMIVIRRVSHVVGDNDRHLCRHRIAFWFLLVT